MSKLNKKQIFGLQVGDKVKLVPLKKYWAEFTKNPVKINIVRECTGDYIVFKSVNHQTCFHTTEVTTSGIAKHDISGIEFNVEKI